MKKEVVVLFVYLLFNLSCNKPVECGCEATATETVNSIFGLIIKTDDGFEILTDEKGLLIPCGDLPENFKIESQPVLVSGTLKIHCKKIADEFKITPIKISDIKLRASNYDKTDITLNIFQNENTNDESFGYMIDDLRTPNGTRIRQPHIPAIPGLSPFITPQHATMTGLLMIYIIRKGNGSITSEILRYINVIP